MDRQTFAWGALSWLGVAVLALGAIAQLQVLGIHGLLLDEHVAATPLGQAALTSNGLALSLWLLAVGGTALSILWLSRRRRADPLGATIGLVAALHVLFLPAVQGILFADRYVRVLDRAPAAAADFSGPTAIVDRGGGKAVLLGFVAGGRTRLVTVNEKDLNGIGIGSVMPIDQFLGARTATATMLLLVQAPPAGKPQAPPAGTGAPSAAAQAKPSDRVATTFWSTVVGQLKHTLKNIGSLGEGGASQGRIFVAEIARTRIAGPSAERRQRPLLAGHGAGWSRLCPPQWQSWPARCRRPVRSRRSPAGEMDEAHRCRFGWRGLGLAHAPPFGRPAMLVNGL